MLHQIKKTLSNILPVYLNTSDRLFPRIIQQCLFSHITIVIHIVVTIFGNHLLEHILIFIITTVLLYLVLPLRLIALY